MAERSHSQLPQEPEYWEGLAQRINADAAAIDYGKLVPLLVEAIKEQQTQITKNQAEIARLKRIGNREE